MNTEDPLAQLRDIHLPDTVSWWPLAPGWWILIGLGLLLMAVAIVFVLRARARTKVRLSIVIAQQQLQTIRQAQPNREQLIESLQLFRRIALTYQSIDSAASKPLTAIAKIVCEQSSITINDGSLKLLDNAQYQPDVEIAQQDWQQLMGDLSLLISKLDQVNLAEASTTHA